MESSAWQRKENHFNNLGELTLSSLKQVLNSMESNIVGKNAHMCASEKGGECMRQLPETSRKQDKVNVLWQTEASNSL